MTADGSTKQKMFRHLKTGTVYELLYTAIMCTNGEPALEHAVYRKVGWGPVFVRLLSEFHEKFVPYVVSED